jgi:hypothetical protein
MASLNLVVCHRPFCCSFISAALDEASKHDLDGAAYEDDESESQPENTKIRTQIMHGYLPPVDVELSIEFGGVSQGQSECRTICIQVNAVLTLLGRFLQRSLLLCLTRLAQVNGSKQWHSQHR